MPIVVPYSAWGNIANLASAAGVASQQPASNALAMQVQQYNQSLVQRQQDEQDKQQAEQDKQDQIAQQNDQYQQTQQRLIQQAQGEQDYRQQSLKQQADLAHSKQQDQQDTQAAKDAATAQKKADAQAALDASHDAGAISDDEYLRGQARLNAGSYNPVAERAPTIPKPSGSGRVSSTLSPAATAAWLRQQANDADKEVANQAKAAALGDPDAVAKLKTARDAAANVHNTLTQWGQAHGLDLQPQVAAQAVAPAQSKGKPVPQSLATKAYATAFAAANGDPNAAKMLAAESLAAQGYDPNTVLKGQ